MLNLTRQERLLLIFLLAVILLGFGINYCLKKSAKLRNFYDCAQLTAGQKQLLIDINQADEETLMALPGVGRQTAFDIVEYRKLHGEFKDKEELKNIKGIGEKKYQSLKDFVVINTIQ